MGNLLRGLLREHPTLALTMTYAVVTLIGVVYSFFFFREFGINILKFADLSDFLLASIIEPVSILIFLGVVLFTLAMFALDFGARKKWPGYGR
jgi:hypothetical protein